jgi:alcohol dehydrogenase
MSTPFQYFARTAVEFGAGSFARLGTRARERGFRRTLLVADGGMIGAGYVARALRSLEQAGVEAFAFHDFGENPDTAMVEAGRAFAAPLAVDSLIGLGGGSSLDCTKAISFVLANGGSMKDYWGYDHAPHPLLPMIGVPTSTGTGSEAQSYALISDAETHVKMACGAPTAAFGAVILDPELAVSQPRPVLAAAGYDAISHSVETFVTAKRTAWSDCFAREAWRLLSASYERMLATADLEAAAAMMMGAYFAGAAIEASMLGATHACANPLTARYGTIHGHAIAVMLAHVVRWNAQSRYSELTTSLDARLNDMAIAAGLPRTLRDVGVRQDELPALAEAASKQWTGKFNPRPFDAAGALELYRCAY